MGLVRPFRGQVQITQPFGPTTLASEPALYGYEHFHTGVDYALPEGEPLYASHDGYCTYSGWDQSGYGNRLDIQYWPGVVGLHAHLSELVVTAGHPVKKGQLIGHVGSTGNSTAHHLHWSIVAYGWYIPPAALVFEP